MIYIWVKKNNPDIKIFLDATTKKEAKEKLKKLLKINRLPSDRWILEEDNS